MRRLLASAAALLLSGPLGAQDFVCLPLFMGLDPEAGDQFGCSVATGSRHFAVGANLDDDVAVDAGSATVFDRGTRFSAAKLHAADAKAGDQFGFAAAFDGEVLAIGAPLADGDRAVDAGAVYLFEQERHPNGTLLGWRQVAKLTASDGARGDRFGQSVSFASGVLLIGAPNHAARGSLSGAAYVFLARADPVTGRRGQIQKLTASDAAPFDNFGHSVAFDGTTAVVGAPFADPGRIANAGAAYVFRNAGGTLSQTAKLVGERAAHNRFGWAVAVDGATLVVGSPGDDGDAGAVTVFSLLPQQLPNSQPQLLIGPQHAPAARFGAAVTLDGNHLAVGAPREVDGVVHVFIRPAEGAPFALADPLPPAPEGSGYGQAVSLEMPDLLIGAFEGPGFAQPCVLPEAGSPPKLAVEKTSPNLELSPGDRVSYRIAVRNLEVREVTAIRVTDEFPSPLRNVTWCRPDDSACSDPQRGNVDLTLSLPANGQAVIQAFGTLRPTTRRRLVNVACAQNPEMPEPKCAESRIPIVQPPVP